MECNDELTLVFFLIINETVFSFVVISTTVTHLPSPCSPSRCADDTFHLLKDIINVRDTEWPMGNNECKVTDPGRLD